MRETYQSPGPALHRQIDVEFEDLSLRNVLADRTGATFPLRRSILIGSAGRVVPTFRIGTASRDL
jgi:hypothetical protein